MTTLFSAALSRLGLSQAEAAAALGVRIDTLKSWACGRRVPPETIWPEIAELARRRAVDMRELAREIERRIRAA